jgi:hypothetical protein
VGSAVHVNVYDLWESNDSVVRHLSKPWKPPTARTNDVRVLGGKYSTGPLPDSVPCGSVSPWSLTRRMGAGQYWCGVGIFHSGVEVYDSEYAYGAHDYT